MWPAARLTGKNTPAAAAQFERVLALVEDADMGPATGESSAVDLKPHGGGIFRLSAALSRRRLRGKRAPTRVVSHAPTGPARRSTRVESSTRKEATRPQAPQLRIRRPVSGPLPYRVVFRLPQTVQALLMCPFAQRYPAWSRRSGSPSMLSSTHTISQLQSGHALR